MTLVYKCSTTSLLVRLNYANLHKRQKCRDKPLVETLKRFTFIGLAALTLSLPKNLSADTSPQKREDKKEETDAQHLDLGLSFSGIRGYDNNDDGETINVGFEQYALRLRLPLVSWLETVTQVGLQNGHLQYHDPKLQPGIELNLKLESDLTVFASEDIAFILSHRSSRFALEYFGRFEIIRPGATSAESITLDSSSSSLNVTDLANSGIKSATYFDYRADTGLSLRFRSTWFRARLRLAYTFLHVDLKIKYNQKGMDLMDDFNITDNQLRDGKFEWDKHGGYLQPSIGAVLDWLIINLEGALFKVNSTLIYQLGANASYRFDSLLN